MIEWNKTAGGAGRVSINGNDGQWRVTPWGAGYQLWCTVEGKAKWIGYYKRRDNAMRRAADLVVGRSRRS